MNQTSEIMDLSDENSSSQIFERIVQKHREQQNKEEMEVEQQIRKNQLQTNIRNTSEDSVSSIPSDILQQHTNQQLTKRIKRKNYKKLKQVEYKLVLLSEKCIYRDITTIQKCYMLSGGLVIEIEKLDQFGNDDLVGSLKNIQFVKKHNDGAISISVENRNLVKQFDIIINILERTQNQDNYTISTMIRQYSSPITSLNQSIQTILSQYDQNSLLSIIQERQDYMQQNVNKFIQDYLKEDEFAQMVTFQINWAQETVNLSSFYLSKAVLAILGTVDEEYIHYIMRNGLFQMFSSYSRRKILDIAVQFYLNNDNNYMITIDEIPDFEIVTLDNIIVKCCCQIHTIRIKFPEHLQFPNQNNSNINNIESVSVLKFIITQQHLERIINLRSQVINKNVNNFSSNSSSSSEDKESLDIAQNFEYYMQSELFLQNFYQEKYLNLQKKQLQKLQVCSYKHI